MKSLGAVEQRVDREVAAKRVFLRRAESVVEADQRIVGVGDGFSLFAEGGDLDILPPEENVHQPKAAADHPRVAEQVTHLLRMRRRSDVEILGLAREHQVAHSAAHQVRVEARAGEPVEDLQYVGIDIAARDGMFRAS